ncbi:ABC transporter ATP-binding protein [Peterkaempfera bronchialis]|uniref:ABC transporter ATP-binding protein n=1 Tax=Peterkaempfera bronchialis TaxID=2126346 RepID=UPI001E630CB3|nr:ABC transporter ATP-binding protein [Peterkaempfera bronchialis]
MTGDEYVLLPTATPSRTRRLAAELVRPQRRLALLAALVFAAEAAAGLVGPLALGWIVDTVQRRGGTGEVAMAAAVLLTAAAVQAALAAAGRALVAQVGETALARLRERVVARVLALPARRIEEAGTGDLAARVGDDASLVAAAVRSVLPDLAGSALTIGFTVLGLAALDWRFALAGLCALPVQAAALRWYLRHSGPLYAAERVAGGERTRQILESVGGVETVRAFRLGGDHTRRVAERSGTALGFAVRATAMRSKFFGRLNVAEFIGLGLILVAGFHLVRSGQARVGEATAAALLFTRLFDPVNLLLALVARAQEAGAGLARLVGVADLVPADDLTVPDPSGTPAVRRSQDPPPVRVSGVHHAYRPGHPVLHGIDLRLAPGELVTLVGTSGAGKSTLARIVAGVHPPTAGEVVIGSDRPSVLLLDQDTHVFAGTLADNLLPARPDAAEPDLLAALDQAGALPWVQALPQGLRTVVGAGGTRLTPVQAQQLALARLALADPPVAVLDEAAAEAGSDGARTLEAAAREILRGRTALVVAHRLAQAVTADRVVVLDAGRIVEQGPHHQLAAAGGRYAALWAAWPGHTADEPTPLTP